MSKRFYIALTLGLILGWMMTLAVVAKALQPQISITSAGSGRPAEKVLVQEDQVVSTTPVAVKAEIALYAGKHAKTAQAVAFCESGYRPSVVGVIDARDRGLFQINSRWNPSVTDKCAFSVGCATRWFVTEIEKGNLWKWNASKECWSQMIKN